MALTNGIPSSIEKHGLFLFITYTKSKKEKKLRTLRHNNIVLHRVALLGP
jgi:hypothetical protein